MHWAGYVVFTLWGFAIAITFLTARFGGGDFGTAEQRMSDALAYFIAVILAGIGAVIFIGRLFMLAFT